MKIHSISDIPNWLFFPIKQWVDQSHAHLEIFMGIAILIALASFFVTWIMVKKIGRQDERTAPIYLKSLEAGFIVLLICEFLFPNDYLIDQFRLYKYAFSLLAGGIYLLKDYQKENR